MKVLVRTLQGKASPVEVEPTDEVLEFKKKVQNVFSQIESSKSLLIHKGTVLSDDKKVQDYSIKEDDVVIAMVSKKPAVASQPPQSSVTPSSTSTTSEQQNPQSPTPTPNRIEPSISDPTSNITATPTQLVSDDSKATCVVAPTAAPTGQAVQQNASSETQLQAQTTAEATATVEVPPAAGTYEAAASAFCSGSGLEETITQIESMGFPRSEVERALNAAFHNPDRAVEYLMGGIPEALVAEDPTPASVDAVAPPWQSAEPITQQPNIVTPPASVLRPANAPPTSTGTAEATARTGGSTSRALAELRNHPMFEQMRSAIQADPRLLPQMLSVISEQNPQLAQLIVQNQEEFIRMLDERDEGGASGGPPTQGEQPNRGRVELRLTHEEVQAIERLESLGFPRDLAVQAYIACDKNEELAANYLFDNIQDLLGDEGDDVPLDTTGGGGS